MDREAIIETVKSRMRQMIMEWERGRIFFLEDFSCIENPIAVRLYLCELVSEGFIVRLARGIYCKPGVSEGEYSNSYILPDADRIAHALADRENVRIIPYGDVAAEKLGLTGLVVSSRHYLTDGSPRVISLSATNKIYFSHTSEVKMFAFRNETMQMLSSAIRSLGAEFFDDEDKKRRMRELLRTVPEDEYNSDINLPPAWVGKILGDLWNG